MDNLSTAAVYGPNDDAVKRLLDWISAENLVRCKGILDESYIIISDFGEAVSIAHGRIPGHLNWTEIRDNADAMLFPVGLLDEPDWRPYKSQIDNLLFVVDERVTAVLHTQYRGIIDDVIADLRACATCLAVHGRFDAFHARLWNAYEVGGWPCGCIGPEPHAPDWNLDMDQVRMFVYCNRPLK